MSILSPNFDTSHVESLDLYTARAPLHYSTLDSSVTHVSIVWYMYNSYILIKHVHLYVLTTETKRNEMLFNIEFLTHAFNLSFQQYCAHFYDVAVFSVCTIGIKSQWNILF